MSGTVVSLLILAQVLSHDDGRQESKRSTAGVGHAVAFERPGETFAVTKLRVYGSRYGAGYDPYLAVARVSVCDAQMRVLARSFVPYSEWKVGSFSWVDVPVGPCLVPERFHALVEFFAQRKRGVYLGVDENNEGHSLAGVPGRKGRALGGGEWMLRVVGRKKAPKVARPRSDGVVTLARGSGAQIGRRSTAGVGHAVRFKAPAKARMLTKVALFGSRYGGGYDARTTFFHVFVCDAKLRVIARSAQPYALFAAGEPKWVEFDVRPTNVPKDFHVLVHFDPTRTRGVYLGLWEEKGGASLSGYPGRKGVKVGKGQGWMLRATLAPSSGKRELEPVEAAAPPPAPRELREESAHFALEGRGMSDAQAAALLRLMECAHEALTTRFGFERVSAVEGAKIRLTIDLAPGKQLVLFTNPRSPEYSEIVMHGDPDSALDAPAHGGPHNVYGFCHELGHVLMGWTDSRHQWAHYVGSMLLDDVEKKLGKKAWADPYDYREVEGMPRFLREVKGVEPGRDSDKAVARLFYEVGERFGTKVWGPALRWIREERKGEAFDALRRYALDDLRDALAAVTGKKDAVAELFGR